MTTPVETEATPGARWGPPRWLMITTHVVALGWGTCEMAFWGARPGALAFVAATMFGTAGVNAYGKVKDLLP